MTHDARHDALIIGGGPAGATVALLLAKGGWSVAVMEKAAFPRRKVCGEFISATTMPALHKIGVGEAFSNLAFLALRPNVAALALPLIARVPPILTLALGTAVPSWA